MATVETMSFAAGGKVALIVRGKLGPVHHPGNMEQHADCILSNGAPFGFFGEGDGDSSNRVGMSMKGIVYDYPAFQRKRPFYVDLKQAQTARVISTVLLVDVTTAEARAFDKQWHDLAKKPGDFHILGGNCSTRASSTFVGSGILKDGIPGLDTPDNLYAQLAKKRTCKSITGFLGFVPASGGGYEMVWEPYVTTRVPHPDQSSWSSN